MLSLNYSAIFLLLVGAITLCHASNGDRTQFFHNCRQNCERTNCSADGLEIQEQAVNFYKQSIFDQIFQWSCADECQYGCMWRTVAAFAERAWPIPQFYGKWPFLRMLGMQEPASVIFSMLNCIMHFRMLRKFRREVRPDSPCYMLAHIFGVTCLNGWIWSSIFHTRDFPLTELLDYAFAYSIVLCTFYCMVMRMLHRYSLFLRGVITLAIVSYYINYFAYLSVGKFNYSFNMKVNIATGVLSALGWFIWCHRVRTRRPYFRRILRFYILFALAMSLELLDFPPICWILDAHALWHFATVPLVSLYYNFMIEDCRTLRKEKVLSGGYSSYFNKDI
ncbi:GL11111 [Drosophila persimilis]|uniref:Post-GPI attachment to proteins factor 3 n=1 Tax=Drosophila persimilis TaxID=7234 RepID=B4GC69_DROPE|nr:post-GPI attachment to proteins factor 3 [Drosophila persimilis]XP_026841182.1 post-GPI attachment to proteins factor 3 [Drosophila persimilis]EDW31387.1 GL11111 [Drosophila persimilis]